jgi:2-polyprenyl-3-methyl-5-hydroxy-6-metoxy-1,4-benzoquinol methylase
MSFYDNFTKRDKISKVGKLIVARQNNFFIQLILKYTPKDKKYFNILEVGPGKGYFAKECKKNKFFKYVAIEANQKIYKELKRQGFLVFNKKAPPIQLNSTFDVIFMNQVIEHMQDRSEVLQLFKECKIKLNKNGILIISTPDIRYFKEDFFACDYTHQFPFSLYSLKQVFVDFDFKIKYAEVKTIFFKGYFITRIISVIVNTLYNFGIIKLLFGKKSYKIKNLGKASCIVVGKKNE